MSYSTAALRVHQFLGLETGPALIILGAVHGSEKSGTRGIERVLQELDAGTLSIVRGRLTLVPVTNPLAYQKGERNGDRNLNRNLRPTASPQDFEDRIANALCPLLAQHEALLDLHSFQSPGEAFAMIGPANNTGTLEPFAHAEKEQSLALRLGPRRMVEGWLSTYATGVQERLARTAPTDRAGLLSTDPATVWAPRNTCAPKVATPSPWSAGSMLTPLHRMSLTVQFATPWPTWGWSMSQRPSRAVMWSFYGFRKWWIAITRTINSAKCGRVLTPCGRGSASARAMMAHR